MKVILQDVAKDSVTKAQKKKKTDLVQTELLQDFSLHCSKEKRGSTEREDAETV